MPFSYAFDMAYRLRQQHPGMFVLNAQGAFETIVSCHWDWEFARRIGAPGPYDVTSQRIACLAHAVTDWWRRWLAEIPEGPKPTLHGPGRCDVV